MTQTNPDVTNMFKQLRHQVTKRHKGSLKMVGEGSSTPIIDLVPPSSGDDQP